MQAIDSLRTLHSPCNPSCVTNRCRRGDCTLVLPRRGTLCVDCDVCECFSQNATRPDFVVLLFGFYSPDLEGFTGIGHSVEDCLYKAKWGMEEHIELMKEQGLPVPPSNPDPTVLIVNERRDEIPKALDKV